MTDPNHPIFKQFPELDPKLITIRDTPHPDWVWNQPPIAGTLTPGYAHRIPGQPYMPGSSATWTAPLESSQVQFKPQEWQADFPGLWDDVPGSGTSQMPHVRAFPVPRYNGKTDYSEGLAGSAGRLSESQGGQKYDVGIGKGCGAGHHRL